MLDIDLIFNALREHGHTVAPPISVPENAGEYEFIVDGVTLSLAETRALLERDELTDPHAKHVTQSTDRTTTPPSERML